MKNEKIIYKIISRDDEGRRLDRRYVLLGTFIFVMVAVFSFLWTRSLPDTNAVDFSGFKAGNIISDGVMRNYTSMTESQIQDFLNKKVSCNRSASGGWYVDASSIYGVKYNYKANYNGTTYFYHVENGKYVCMNSESFNGESAAHIIYSLSQQYKINPQVLLVLLEKEQGLVSDSWPNSNFQYRSATGFGCPDTAPCDSEYYGLRNQVESAAWLFNQVLSGGWTNYDVGWNDIRYSPDAACGASRVYIENKATASLYRYTPYQPNAEALRNYPGGSYCGAYGNRNFYAFFTEWFGSTQIIGDYTINEAYNSLNDQQKTDRLYVTWAWNVRSLGKITGTVKAFSKDSKYRVLETEKGVIFGNDEIGYKTYKKKAFEAYTELFSALGLPAGDYGKNDSTKIEWYIFKNGALLGNDEKGWFVSMGASRNAWANLGYETGALGFPKSNITTNNFGVTYQEYDGGILASGNGKTFYVMKEKAFESWMKNVVELGKITSGHGWNGATGIEWYGFEKGLIVGNNKKGWHISAGKIRDIWSYQGYETGYLGFPTSDISEQNGVYSQTYEGGIISGNDKTGYSVENTQRNKVYEKYKDVLGAQVGTPGRNPWTGMEWYSYEGGLIVGNNSRGWFVSYGKSRDVWARTGFENGLGFPISDIEKNEATGMEWQSYERGVIMGNDKRGWFESRGMIRTIWAASGFEYGRFGFPQTDIINSCQKYDGGWICA